MFILKSTHDALMAAKDSQISELKAEVVIERASLREMIRQHDAYVAQMAEMTTRQVAARTPPPPTPKREEDEADTAIEFVSRGNAQVKRHLERYAKGERRRGVDPQAIAQAVLHGDRPSDEEGVPE